MNRLIQARIIELFISGEQTMAQLSELFDVSFEQIKTAIQPYYLVKDGHEITLISSATLPEKRFLQMFWNRFSARQLCDIMNISKSTLQNIAFRNRLPRKRKIYNGPLNVTYRSRSIILNEETGIYYFSYNEAAKSVGRSEDWLKWQCTRAAKNNTQFKFHGSL